MTLKTKIPKYPEHTSISFALTGAPVPVRILRQKLFNLFWEMPFGAPHESNHRHDDCYRHKSQPEGFVEHPLTQRFVRYVLHPPFAPGAFPPCVASTRESVALFQAQSAIFAWIGLAGAAFSRTRGANVPRIAMALESGLC